MGPPLSTALEIIYCGHHHLLVVVGRGCVWIHDPQALLLQMQLVLVQGHHAVPLVHPRVWQRLLLLLVVLNMMVGVHLGMHLTMLALLKVVSIALMILLLLLLDGRMNHRLMIIIVLQSGVSIIRIIIRIRLLPSSRGSIITIMPIVVVVVGSRRRMPRRSNTARVIFRDYRRVRRLVLRRGLMLLLLLGSWRTVVLSDWNGYGRRQFRSEIQEAHRYAH